MLPMFYNGFFSCIGCNFQLHLKNTWRRLTSRLGTFFFCFMFFGFGKDGSKGDHIMISSMNFFFYSWLHGRGCEAYPFQPLMFMVATNDYTFSSGSVIHTNQWHVVTFSPKCSCNGGQVSSE